MSATYSSATTQTRYNMAKMNMEDIELIEQGREPKNLVKEFINIE